jgi:HD-like signal output (HDOD) protein
VEALLGENAIAMGNYRALVSSVDALEPLPLTVLRLTEVISQGEHDISEIVEVVSLDQALTAALLRRANSAMSGTRAPVATVREAVVRLGSGPLLSMAFAATVSNRMIAAMPAYGMVEGELWQNSVAASVTADVIRTMANAYVPSEASTAALLHDIGKVVICNHYGPQTMQMLIKAAETDHVSPLHVERTVFGADHAQIGGVVAGRWNLPETIVEAISFHHDLTTDQTPIGAAVAMAHSLIPAVISSPTSEGLQPRASVETVAGGGALAGLLQVLEISPIALPSLLESAQNRYASLAARYSG